MLFREYFSDYGEILIHNVSVETLSPGYFGIRYNINNNFLLDWRKKENENKKRKRTIEIELMIRFYDISSQKNESTSTYKLQLAK